MSNHDEVDWRELCRRASEEHDPQKLIEIIQQLNDALDDRPTGTQPG